MGRYSRREIVDAFAKYNEARIRSQETNDWSIWAQRFTEDAHYIEHAYGDLHGRAEIEKWICDVMSPFPQMTFPQDWVAFDDEHDAIVFQCQNRLPHPSDPDGPPFQFPTWTRLVYGGNGLFASEEDCYNPVKDANPVIKAWLRAGGKFATREKVKMKYVPQPPAPGSR
jgi:hypothetical protein